MSEAPATIEGVLDRFVFSNPDTAWSVVRILPEPAENSRKAPEPITAVGNLIGLRPGELVRLTGKWVQDKRWGRQFQVQSYLPVKPGTVRGIERYLASGLVPGIGKEMAKRLVRRFGLATLEVIETDGDRLKEVPGIGPVRAQRIIAAWNEQREVKDVMLFLQTHGVSPAYAARIFKKYGRRAIQVVRDNPYQLAEEVFGIGFRTADRIAAELGIDRRSPQRAAAGVLFAIKTLAEEGNAYAPRAVLLERTAALLEVEPQIAADALAALVASEAVVEERLDAPERDALWLPALFASERTAAEHLARVLTAPRKPLAIDVPRALDWFEGQAGITLAEAQRRAIARAIEAKVSVITGGPGTGKTTIVNAIIRILRKKGRQILLAAPTGRAAKRMQETSGQEARTLHRLLEFDPKAHAFTRDAENPLEADMVVIDEMSMVDLPLFAALARALPDPAQLVLVGDVDQLPSVGPGSVLSDIIRSGCAGVTRLEQIFRQAEASAIVVNAHRIQRGELPQFPRVRGDSGDFFLIERAEPEAVLETIKTLVKERIPRRFGVDPIDDIQVLTPMHRGTLGAQNLNVVLQGLLNPDGEFLARGDRIIRRRDKVMQLRNNYDLGVLNGDVGRVEAVDPEERTVLVRFDDRSVRYESGDLDELSLAYACSIHKSQGSEYPVVVLPLSTQHYVMLERNLIYTAVTRGKRLVVVVGSWRALSMAVKTEKRLSRWSRLETRLQQACACSRLAQGL